MRAVVWFALFGFVACDSNPTPHPGGGDATYDTRVDTAEPGENKGPDDDGDGVPDCQETGGFWDGDNCRNDVTGAADGGGGDAAAVPDAGDASDEGDGDVGDAGDAGDGDRDGSESGDVGQSDSGPDAAR